MSWLTLQASMYLHMSASGFLVVLTLAATALAHKHSGKLSDEEAHAPVDALLWIHIFLQAAVWGVLFPTGMILGITRSRWHVPVQSMGFALTTAGFILGHSHGGRMFLPSVHGSFASILFIPMAAQLLLGIYLKLHIHEESLRPWAVRGHGILGKSYPILGWTQMLFGAVTFRGYCRGGNLGQCLAHYIMGSGFIAYGIIMAILLVVGEAWIRRSGRSPEWWDSWIIMLWGIVNTFTEHRGATWSVKDMQHTILGVLWWTGGLLGIFLARNNQRNVVPGVIIILTGWAMSEHSQKLMISTKVHATFGNTLMLAGATRIIEVCFLAPKFSTPDDDERTLTETTITSQINGKITAGFAFRHLPPFLLVSAGLIFMSGTDEELDFVHDNGMDHVTYLLIMYSMGFLIYTLVLSLIHLYASSGRNAGSSNSRSKHGDGSIELIHTKWYERIPNAEVDGPQHVVGDEDD